MGLLRRLVDAFDPPETRSHTRPTDVSWDFLHHMAPYTVSVGGHLAEHLSTVLSCVNAISTAIASLPAEVQRRRPDGDWETDDTHPLALLIRDGANPHQSWPDFLEWLLASTLLTGNGLSEIRRDATGAVRELSPIPWHGVSVQRLPSGRLAFDVSESITIPGSSSRLRRLLEGEVLFLKDRSDDGLIGRSRLQRAAGVIRPSLDLQQFVGAMWRNGVHPSGALELEGKLENQQRKQLADDFRQAFGGPVNAARALVLDQGLKWKSISVSPEDAELLMSRRFTVEELARLFNCPPPLVGDLSHGSFANVEHLLRWFGSATLAPWTVKLENEFHRSVFTVAARRTHRLELDLSGLLRGDPETRWKSHEIAVKNQILTVDEVRDVEGWPPRGERPPAVSAV